MSFWRSHSHLSFTLRIFLSITGRMNEARPALLPTCFPAESANSQPESQSSCRLLLQFRYSSSEVWKCLKQSQQFSDPLQYQTLQLCVIAAMLKWGQLLEALTPFPFSPPWCSGSVPSTYSELSLAFSPWLYCSYIYVILSLLPYGFLWGK